MSSSLQVHHFEPSIRSLGPGERAAVWLQGCSRGCPGCIASGSHDPAGGVGWAIGELADRIVGLPGIEGVTISGGEPFDQSPGLAFLLQSIGEGRPELGVMVFTGYQLEELEGPDWRNALDHVDILVDGPFLKGEQVRDPWRGSANQRIHYLSDRYSEADHSRATSGVELFVHGDGSLFMAGVPEPGFMKNLKTQLAATGVFLPFE